MTFKIGWFSTGRDEAARELFQTVVSATGSGLINGQVSVVFSNREKGEAHESDRFFSLVESKGAPLVCFSSSRFLPELWRSGKDEPEKRREWRRLYDRQAMSKLERHPFDLAVLAGYMLIAGEELCQTYKMINLHPAAPGGPTGTWQEVIWELIKSDAAETGVMMHLVTPELDRGPVIAYVTFSIKDGGFNPLRESFQRKLEKKTFEEIVREEGENEPLFAEIRREGVRRELPLILYTLKGFAEGKIEIDNGKVISGGKVLEKGCSLNEEIEKHLSEKEL